MKHEPSRSQNETHSQSASSPFAGQGVLGTILLLTGAGIVMLAVIDRTAGLPFEMPRTWYFTPSLWYFIALICFFSGVRLLGSVPVENPRWEPHVPGRRFDRVVLYTKEECHLCHQAKDVLYSYRQWLPEIEEVDITTSPELLQKFSEQIPVVEIDGQVRFRGHVNEVLFRRLIEATPPK